MYITSEGVLGSGEGRAAGREGCGETAGRDGSGEGGEARREGERYRGRAVSLEIFAGR